MREHDSVQLTCVHEVAKELPAGRHLKEVQLLLLGHAVQGAAGGHAARDTLQQECTARVWWYKGEVYSAAEGPKPLMCMLQKELCAVDEIVQQKSCTPKCRHCLTMPDQNSTGSLTRRQRLQRTFTGLASVTSLPEPRSLEAPSS